MGHMSPYKDQSLGTVHYLYRRKMSKFRYSRTLFLAIIANCHHSAIWPCVTSHPCCAIIPSEITSFVVSGVVCGVRMSLLIPQYWQYALVDILASWSYRKVENNCLGTECSTKRPKMTAGAGGSTESRTWWVTHLFGVLYDSTARAS